VNKGKRWGTHPDLDDGKGHDEKEDRKDIGRREHGFSFHKAEIKDFVFSMYSSNE
jgi:hypothetical protein